MNVISTEPLLHQGMEPEDGPFKDYQWFSGSMLVLVFKRVPHPADDHKDIQYKE